VIAHLQQTGADPVHRRRPGAFAYGVIGVLFALVVGNFFELGLALRALAGGGLASIANWQWYWDATRVISHAPAEAHHH
jgi:hypothetical protein